MRLLPKSLALRVLAMSTLWAVVTLIVVATIIATLYRQASENGFRSLLSAHLFNLIGSVSATPDGVLNGSPNLGDLRFSFPRSGWYWSVEPVSGELTGTLRSLSMAEDLPAPSAEEIPFDAEFQRNYFMEGLAGEEIEVFEAEFTLDADDRAARFRVMGNRSELEEEIARFEGSLYTYLVIFGAGMIAINAAAILIGLRPLRRVREALANIRTGAARRLDGEFPSEIAPLASETNALIENNRRIVERSRTQVGNLAHSLKTPLAVLVNEGRALGGDRGRLVAEQAELMRHQVDHYLQRARIAAQRDSVTFRTPVGPVLERMTRVMAKIGPGIDIGLEPVPQDAVFGGEREDLEEIAGNLLENAMKWAASRVRVSVEVERGEPGILAMIIEDDGPGIPEDRARDALKRGGRLDETKPGTGLGLAIVSELVSEYGGALTLDRSPLGGLKATVRLTQAP